MTARMDQCFSKLAGEKRPGLVTYFMGGDPDYAASLSIMKALPEAGADIIELGMPFSDPMADGPAIQAAGLRALKGGQTLAKTLQMARDFRADNDSTPIVMMGYYNPIYIYGVDRFLADAKSAGIDGLIIVDLPPEMDDELCLPALEAGISFIRLATPTTDDKRLPVVLEQHIRICLLRIHDRYHRLGAARHGRRWVSCGHADQAIIRICRSVSASASRRQGTGARPLRAFCGRCGCRNRDRQRRGQLYLIPRVLRLIRPWIAVYHTGSDRLRIGRAQLRALRRRR